MRLSCGRYRINIRVTPSLLFMELTSKSKRALLCLSAAQAAAGKQRFPAASMGLFRTFYEGTFSGEVYLNGRNTGDYALRDFGTIVGSVFQDPRSQFFMTDTTNEIAFGCVNMKLPREEVWQRTKNSLEKINISKLTDKNLFQLSSGEMQKVSIASCYAMAPDIYVFDEPPQIWIFGQLWSCMMSFRN